MVAVRRVRFFKQAVTSRTKFHVSVGHTTVLATAIFFTDPEQVGTVSSLQFSPHCPAHLLPRRLSRRSKALSSPKVDCTALLCTVGGLQEVMLACLRAAFDGNREYPYVETLSDSITTRLFAVLEFATPVVAKADALIIASRLDTDQHENTVL